MQLGELQEHYDEIRALGGDLWTIANSDPERLRALRDESGLEFPILLDPDATVIKEYGLLNDMDDRGRLIPHPAVVIIDHAGVVQYEFIETNYRLRPASSDLVEILRGHAED